MSYAEIVLIVDEAVLKIMDDTLTNNGVADYYTLLLLRDKFLEEVINYFEGNQ